MTGQLKGLNAAGVLQAGQTLGQIRFNTPGTLVAVFGSLRQRLAQDPLQLLAHARVGAVQRERFLERLEDCRMQAGLRVGAIAHEPSDDGIVEAIRGLRRSRQRRGEKEPE